MTLNPETVTMGEVCEQINQNTRIINNLAASGRSERRASEVLASGTEVADPQTGHRFAFNGGTALVIHVNHENEAQVAEQIRGLARTNNVEATIYRLDGTRVAA